jgi:hypothetical protein
MSFLDAGFHGQHVHLAPALGIGQPGILGDGAGVVRRDDVDHVGLVVVEIGEGGVGLGIHPLDHLAAGRPHPFDHAGVLPLPGLFEQPLLGEGVVGIEDQHLGFVLAVVLEVAGDLRGALVGAGRAAERAGRHGEHEGLPPSFMASSLLLQRQRLRAGFPGVRVVVLARLRYSPRWRRS